MLADRQQAGRDEHGAHHERVEQHAERHGGADLGDGDLRDLGERGEGPASTMPAAVITPPVTPTPRSVPSVMPRLRDSSLIRALRKML